MSASFDRIEELFNQAMDLGREERGPFLAEACGQDSALMARVQLLLQAHETGARILAEEPQTPSAAGLIAEKPGDWIGHFKLIEQIGDGGCGVVFMAEQLQPVRRRVALKIIKLGMDTKSVVARFEAERQALARMDHPNIAKVLDAGNTQTGRPFFVMELVRGVRITAYCDQNEVSTAQTLELFVQVCRAIQHAHHKGIIHRDIKPSNVLVSVHDGVPVPKVIDFGIAKAIEGRLTDQTVFTSFEQFIGTPAYMSPEQALLNSADVDIRTDIYSLGVLLYELLIGKTPFDANALLASGIDAMRRTILEQEPLRPSTRLTAELAREHQSNKTASAEQANEPRRLLQQQALISVLRGDLDWIVMKCLEKDRSRRYETANGLAMDIQRYLNCEPVLARPPSTLYQLEKLIRRNKLAFAAATAVTSALLLGVIASTWEAILARRAERAQVALRQEAERARAGEARQRVAAEDRLYEALLGEARAKQLSGHAGQRFDSLDALTKAAAIHPTTDLSDEAVAAVASPDVREQRGWKFGSHWAAEGLCFDQSCESYAQKLLSGISIRRVSDDHELALIQLPDVEDVPNDLLLRRFDAHSRYLAASCLMHNQDWRCRVWDVAHGGALALDVPGAGCPDFSPDGQTIAVINPNGTVSVHRLNSGKELMRIMGAGRLDALRFNPENTKLAGLAMGDSTLRVWDALSGRLLTSIQCTNALTAIAWNQDGTLLATGFLDGQIAIWSADSGRLKLQLEGHESRVTTLAYSHLGDVLASGSWDHTLRLWDPAGGHQLLVFPTQDTDLHFSPDDQLLAYAIEGQTARLLQVAHGRGYQRMAAPPELHNSWTVDFSPDGRLALTAHDQGIAIWDVLKGKELGLFQTSACRSAHFQASDELAVVASTEMGLFRWPIHGESTAQGEFIRVDVPQKLASEFFHYSTLGNYGTRILTSTTYPDGPPLIVDLANPTNRIILRGHTGAQFVAMDRAGRWAATGTWKGKGVRVYEASSGKPLRDLPVKGTAFVAFSPDGSWLATADMTEIRLWRTDTWEPSPHFVEGDGISEINPLTFSPDGRLVAVTRGPYQIQMLRVPTFEPVATLRPSTRAGVSSLCFSPDGSKLVALEWIGHLDIWDLRIIRRELAMLHLDWHIPPFDSSRGALTPGPEVLRLDAAPFSKEYLAKCIPPRDPRATADQIDLTEYYNAPLNEDWCGANKDGNDLSEVRPGLHEFHGVDFDVRGLIQIGMAAENGLAYPTRVEAITIDRRCRRLHFLHAARSAGAEKPGDHLARYIVHYSDGRQIELPVLAGRDVGDWWAQPEEKDCTFVVAWNGSNRAAQKAGRTIRLFTTGWDNPFPEVPIRDLDFIADEPASGHPFLLAITAHPNVD